MNENDDFGGGDFGSTGSAGDFSGGPEVSYQSWFSRIASAFGGMVLGLVLFVIAFPVLFWNEGRAVHRAQDLDEGQKGAETTEVQTVDPAREGKLVFASGTATTSESLRDAIFGVTTKDSLWLKRSVEMYQWKETEHTEKKKNLGGGETTTKSYTYDKTWSSSLIDSTQFHQPQGHQNPRQFPCPATEYVAAVIQLGAFQVPENLKSSLHDFKPLEVTSEQIEGLAEDQATKWRVSKGQFYSGQDADNPAVGDTRVHFQHVPSGPCGLVGVQTGASFAPFTTRNGAQLFELRSGQTTKDDFFRRLNADNNLMTWILRLVGFGLMYFGLMLLFRPMSVLADIVPFFGTLVGYGTGLLAFLLALPMSLTTIAIGWIVYRPMLGIGLLVVSVGLIVILGRGISRARTAQ